MPAKPEMGHWAGGHIPEEYRGPTKRGTSDYPKTTEGFVPVGEIRDTSGLNPEEHLLKKEEEGLLDLGQRQMWDDLMKEDVEEGDADDLDEGATVDYMPGAKPAGIEEGHYEKMAEDAEETLDTKADREEILASREKGKKPEPRYYRHTKISEGGDKRVVRGQHPQKTPKSKTQFRKTA